MEMANFGVISFDFLKPFRHSDLSTFSVPINSFIFVSYTVIGNSSQLTLNVLKIEQNSDPGRPSSILRYEISNIKSCKS